MRNVACPTGMLRILRNTCRGWLGTKSTRCCPIAVQESGHIPTTPEEAAQEPVSRDSFGIRCGGIKLQSCRKTENRLCLGPVRFCFCTPADWQGGSPGPDHLLSRHGKSADLVHLITTSPKKSQPGALRTAAMDFLSITCVVSVHSQQRQSRIPQTHHRRTPARSALR